MRDRYIKYAINGGTRVASVNPNTNKLIMKVSEYNEEEEEQDNAGTHVVKKARARPFSIHDMIGDDIDDIEEMSDIGGGTDKRKRNVVPGPVSSSSSSSSSSLSNQNSVRKIFVNV